MNAGDQNHQPRTAPEGEEAGPGTEEEWTDEGGALSTGPSTHTSESDES